MENKADLAKFSGRNLALGFGLILLGATLAAGGIYVGETDDAPGAALLGLTLEIMPRVEDALRGSHSEA